MPPLHELFQGLEVRDDRPNPSMGLHEAASKGFEQAICDRLDKGANINELDSGNWAPLHLAIQEGHIAAMKLLLDRGADISIGGGGLGAKPLDLAAMSLNPSLMAALLEYRPNLEARTNGLTALYYAISAGDEGVAQLLLEAGADVKARTTCDPGTGESVLHMAVASFKHSILSLLIRYGADVNAAGTNPAGQTALHIATQYGDEVSLRELIKAGADVFATFPDGQTALDVAAKEGRINTASILLEHGFDVRTQNERRMSPLYMAAIHNRVQMVEFLLDRGADNISKDRKLHVVAGAAGTGRIGILKFLERKGFPLIGQDDVDTGLHLAAYFGHKDTVIFLLRKGANPWQRNSINRTALDMASAGNHSEIVTIIRDASRQLMTNPRAELFPDWKPAPESDSNSASFQTDLAAKLISLYASRKIHANQEPAGIFSCEMCKDLDFRRGMSQDAEVVYFMGILRMRSSGSSGCRGCRFLSDCLDRANEVYGDGIWGNGPLESIVLHSMALGAPLLMHVGDHTSMSRQRVEIYVKEGSGTTWATVGIGRDTSPSTWSEERADIARKLLEECVTSHPNCSSRKSLLPRRVIQVGSIGDDPRLYISNGEQADYVTLSHSWGGVSTITTTTETLQQRVKSISYKDLSKTFRDAVAITRSLGIEYLWIDSLCILQDSKEDWKAEAVKMKNVYAGCYVMISANDSPNAHGGCFSPGGTDYRSYAVDSLGPWFSKVKANIRLTHLRDEFHMEGCHRIGDTQSTSNTPRNLLNTRGWTFQERVLAPRILHFNRSEFAWECPERLACECQPTSTSWDKKSRFKALFADSRLRKAQASFGKDGRTDILLWMHFVEEFTRRKLSYSTDTLYALSGLADYMAAATGSEYYCGIWKEQLAEFLMWTVDYGSSPSASGEIRGAAQPFRFPPSTHSSNPQILPKRHKSYLAPSWSWASVIGPIKFLKGRLDTSNRDQLSHIRKDGKIAESDPHKRVSLLGGVEVECFTESSIPYGPPRAASLTAKCLTLSVTWVDKEKSTDSLFRRSEHGGRLVHTQPPDNSSTDSPLAVDFEPDVPDEDLEVSIGDSLLLMYVIEHQGATVAKEEITKEGYKVVSGQEGTTVEGLVLTPASDTCGKDGMTSGQALYRRVGIFDAVGTYWRDLGTMRSITIL
ncbi:hypothetical protein FQN54_007632 [Arachnomyces sp. PD_36]|nr:hypothetical protein FQN54_007632 [Arachnomyces sp. PD_36]